MDGIGGDSDKETIEPNAENHPEKTSSRRNSTHPSIDPASQGLAGDDADRNVVHALQFVNSDLARINRELHEVDTAIARIRQSQALRTDGINRGSESGTPFRLPAALSGGLMGYTGGALMRPGASAAASMMLGSDEMQHVGGPSSSRSLRSSYSEGGPRKRGRPKGTKGVYSRPAKPKPWTVREHQLFLEGIERYGRGHWADIARNVLTNRTAAQIASHAQKHFRKSGSEDGGRKRKAEEEDEDDDAGEEEEVDEREGQEGEGE